MKAAFRIFCDGIFTNAVFNDDFFESSSTYIRKSKNKNGTAKRKFFFFFHILFSAHSNFSSKSFIFGLFEKFYTPSTCRIMEKNLEERVRDEF